MPLLVEFQNFESSSRKQALQGNWPKHGKDPCCAEQQVEECDKNTLNKQDIETKAKRFFPLKLMIMLSSPFYADCVSWCEGGKAFSITDVDKLAEKTSSYNTHIGVNKTKSFARKLNRWGFKMDLIKGPNCGNYSHPLFRKDQPWLCEKMTCNKKYKKPSRNPSYSKVEGFQNRSNKKRQLSYDTTSANGFYQNVSAHSHSDLQSLESNCRKRPRIISSREYSSTQKILLSYHNQIVQNAVLALMFDRMASTL